MVDAEMVPRKRSHRGACCFWAVAITTLVTSFAYSEQGVRQARALLHEQGQLQREYGDLFEEKLRLQSELAEAQTLARVYKEQREAVCANRMSPMQP